jgi:hypothetical protein
LEPFLQTRLQSGEEILAVPNTHQSSNGNKEDGPQTTFRDLQKKMRIEIKTLTSLYKPIEVKT